MLAELDAQGGLQDVVGGLIDSLNARLEVSEGRSVAFTLSLSPPPLCVPLSLRLLRCSGVLGLPWCLPSFVQIAVGVATVMGALEGGGGGGGERGG